MFPTPIQQRSHASQFSYQVFLPIALILWLLPLIAVMIFSIKPDGDFVKGNSRQSNPTHSSEQTHVSGVGQSPPFAHTYFPCGINLNSA